MRARCRAQRSRAGRAASRGAGSCNAGGEGRGAGGGATGKYSVHAAAGHVGADVGRPLAAVLRLATATASLTEGLVLLMHTGCVGACKECGAGRYQSSVKPFWALCYYLKGLFAPWLVPAFMVVERTV